jgi:hypothetical protein
MGRISMSKDESDLIAGAVAEARRFRSGADEQRPETTAGADPRPCPRATRYPYSKVQHAAPYSGDALPERSEFREVRCCNISKSGLAFIWQQPPDFEQVVVRLGPDARAIYLTARVVRSQPLNDDPAPAHLVACQSVDRVSYPDSLST